MHRMKMAMLAVQTATRKLLKLRPRQTPRPSEPWASGFTHPAGDAHEVVEPESAKGGEDDELQHDAGNDGLAARLLQLGLGVAGGAGDARRWPAR